MKKTFFFHAKSIKAEIVQKSVRIQEESNVHQCPVKSYTPYIQYTYNPFTSWGVVTQVIIIAKLHRVISMLYRIIRTGVDRSPTTVCIIGAREREREKNSKRA